jgi:hypothetical protein
MKQILVLILSFFFIHTFAQTREKDVEIKCAIIERLKELDELKIVEYPNMSGCGGFITGYFLDSNLLLVKAIHNAEAGYISQDTYLYNNKIIKILYNTHSALWTEHETKYPIEAENGDYTNMTYADTVFVIYNLETPIMSVHSNSEMINRNFDSEFYYTLISRFNCMKEQLNEVYD